MAFSGNMEKMVMRQQYRNVWHIELMDAPCEDPVFCLFACLCGPCASYMLRKRALYDDMSRYVCCGGYMPCSGHCGESSCPKFCLFSEVFCCFANSVASTRFLLQDEFNIQTTKCDNCIIGFMVCLQQLSCICSIIAALAGASDIEDISELLNCLSDLVSCAVCPCMQTQHKIEMDKRDGKYGEPRLMAAPPVQYMSRLDQPIPPEAGYPPPGTYDKPVIYPPPSQAEGYPPPYQGNGNPPANYPPSSLVQGPPPPFQVDGHPPANYPPPSPGHVNPPLSQAQGPPPPSPGHANPPANYPTPSQGHAYPPANYPPPSPGHVNPPLSQAQGPPPPSTDHANPPANYPTPSQGHAYPPANYPPPSQAQDYPAPSQGHGHPPSNYPPPQGYGPANYPPPAQGQGYPPANYPPPDLQSVVLLHV